MGWNDDQEDGEGGTGLPASFELAWGVRARPTKGPKRGLSLERIVAAAVELAEAEGLPAVSMQRVAKALGTSAMSLYRYVSSKDELLALMVDMAGGKPPRPADPNEGWRDGLSRWAWAYRDLLHRHQWAVRVPISGPPITPNQIAWLEDGLFALRDTNLLDVEKLRIILLISGYVRNDASLVADITNAAQMSGINLEKVMPNYGQLLLRLTDPDRFPALHQAIANGAFDEDEEKGENMTPEFIFGLERILDGIEVLIRQREHTMPAPPPAPAHSPAPRPAR